MEITDIRVRKVNSEGKLKAVVSVTFDGAFVIHDIKLIENEGRMLSPCRIREFVRVSTRILHTR